MIRQLLCKLFPQTIEQIKKESQSFGYSQRQNEDWENRKKIKQIEAEQFQEDGPVITLANEWLNPTIGNIVEIHNEKGLLYGIYDYISKQVIYTTNTPLIFSMQKLKMLGKLTPDEICCLFYEGRTYNTSFHKNKNCMNSETRGFTNYDDWVKKLTENNFFIDFPQFKE